MIIKKLLIATFFLSISIGAFSSRSGDWNNLNGSSYQNVPHSTGIPDYQCVEECVNSGYGHPRDTCQKICSF